MSQSERRLAAIMFTDMVGYTALGQKNESLSLALVEEQRKLIRPILARHNGREIKTIGDAFLVEFPNALDAVRCAYDIQRATREFNISLPDEKRIHLRIGLHLGDVVESQGDISGDAVNVASRIESLAEDGGVCLTRQVLDHVQNKFELPLTSLGLRALKNVNVPLEVYKMAMPWDQPVSTKVAMTLPRDRIAILPFANMSSDPTDEYFADGMTEEIISTISGIRGLGVISRTSVMRYKQTTKSAMEIGRELNAGKLLEGSVRKAGDKVRITVQLIDAQDDVHLWAQSYDRNLKDIFETQSDIARRIADELKLPTPQFAGGRTENVDAYTLCLRARSLWNKRTPEGNEQALLLFEEALRMDPDSARAIAGIADCYHIAGDWGFMDREEGYAKARQFVRRALELDDSLPEARATLGVLLHHDRLYEEAQAELRKAISLNPSYATAHHWYSAVLSDMGKFGEGTEEIEEASNLDPLSPIVLWHLAITYYYAGRLDDMMAVCTKIIQTEPGFANAYFGRSVIHALRGSKEEARRDLQTFRRLMNRDCEYKVHLATFEALWGNKQEGLRLIEEVLPLFDEPSSWRWDASPAEFYAAIGDREQFFKWANWSIDRHSAATPSDFRYDPQQEQMREDPRFKTLLTRLGLQ